MNSSSLTACLPGHQWALSGSAGHAAFGAAFARAAGTSYVWFVSRPPSGGLWCQNMVLPFTPTCFVLSGRALGLTLELFSSFLKEQSEGKLRELDRNG